MVQNIGAYEIMYAFDGYFEEGLYFDYRLQ